MGFEKWGGGKASVRPAPYTSEEMARDALAVLGAEEIERAHVLGVSLGGTIAQHLVLMAPDRVRSLALGSTWAGPSDWRSRLRRMQLGILESNGVEALVRARVLFIFSPTLFESAPQMMDLIEKTMAETPLQGYPHQIEAA